MSDRVAGVGSRKCEITDEGSLELEGCHPPAASGRDWPACLAAATLALPARDTANPIEGRTSDTLASLTGASRLDNPANPPCTAEAARNSKSLQDPCSALELPNRV